MKRILSLVVFIVLIAMLPAAVAADTGTEDASPDSLEIDDEAKYRVFSSGFIPNVGQYDPGVEYVLQYQGTTVFFMRDGLVLTHTSGGAENISKDIIWQSFVGASTETHLTLDGRRPGVVNYYIGNDSSQWLRDVPVYAEIVYEDLYPGIDLAYSENNGRLKREFRVSPGADPSRIELLYEGENEPYVGGDGVLRFASPAGEMLESPLVCWQVIGGERVERIAAYVVDDGSVRIEMEEYDAGYELIIDPELEYSSYLGGDGYDNGQALVSDGVGGIWVTGYTGIGDIPGSTDFPVHNAYQNNFQGESDVVISHFSSTGALLSSTYFGGKYSDQGTSLAVDGNGGIWVSGCTCSPDFPVLNAHQTNLSRADASYYWDGFVSHFSSTGTLLSSTYLGGEHTDWGSALAGDDSGGVWVVGYTSSIDFPILNAYQNSNAGGWDAFISHFSSTGVLLSSTYLGGGNSDHGYAIAGDGAGGVWVTGNTESTGFPTLNAHQSILHGKVNSFVSHFSSTGTLLSSTYLGGGGDGGYALASDGAGGIWVAGGTGSSDFPVLNTYQSNFSGELDVFVSHFSSTGTLLSSTYLGGGSWDCGFALAGDGAGGVWVAGETYSTNFPVLNEYQCNLSGRSDAFISHFSSTGSILSSTYLGGGGYDRGQALVDGVDGPIWLGGSTGSTDFPVLNAYQSNFKGGESDIFVLKLSHYGSSPPQTRTLPVPYIHQVYDTPTGFNGEAACSETSAVMVLAYHGRLTPEPVTCEEKWVYGGKERSLDPPRISVYGTHVCEEYTYGETTFSEPFTDTTQLKRTATGKGAWGWVENAVNAGTERSEAIVDYLELHDCDVEFIASPSSDEAFAIVRENIDNGQPVIARTYLGGTTGHYVAIVGYSRDDDGTSYFVNDPYGIEPYDQTVLVQHLNQPVEYTYEQMRLGESSRGLIVVHPLLRIQPKKIEEKQKTTIQYDEKNSNTFADPLTLSGDIEEIIARAEDGGGGSNYICLQFEASGHIENPSATITDDKSSVPLSLPASNLKVVKTDSNKVLVYWDGKNGQDSVNQANNPYTISIKAADRSGNSVSSDEVKVWVGRPVLLVHGLTGSAEDLKNKLLYKELSKDHHVEAVEYLPGIDNAFGSIPKYAECLDSEIERIKKEKGAKRVDIVAHSMGGLISRWRIQKIESGDADVGKLIMMGTPNHGAVLSENVMSAISIFEPSMSYPDFAINQMNPGHDFLEKLNGGNSHWYDVVNHDIHSGNPDQIAKRTQYYVIAGAYLPTFAEYPPLPKWTQIFSSFVHSDLLLNGDGVVPYYSAKIANSKTPTYATFRDHLSMWSNNDYLQRIKDLLAVPDDELPIHSEASPYDLSVAGKSQFQQDYAAQSAEENPNPPTTILATTIKGNIDQGVTYYAEFTMNNDTGSLSCLAFWESGTLEIGLTDPDGILAASDTNETMSLLTVPSPRSGVWNLSVSPVSIPPSGTNFSAMLYITHPLYATVVDDTSTYAPDSPVPIAIYVGTADSPATGGAVTCTVETPDGSTDTLDLYDDGAHDDEDPDDGIYGNIFIDTATIGVYFVNISASVPYGCETVERTIKQAITINRYPDLAIQPGGLSASNATPDAGDIITLSTTVENIGEAGATNASVIILDLTENMPDIIAESTFDLDAGESVTVESEWKAEPGTHNITAQISPFAEFTESDYTNNADSTTISTNDYPVEIVSENITFANATLAEIPIRLTNQTDPGYYTTTFLYNDTIISPSDITSDDLNITILSDEGGEFKFNGTVTEGRKGLLHIGNISIQRVGKGGAGTNTTIIIQAYDSSGKPRSLLIVDRIVYLSPIYPAANFTADIQSGEALLAVQFIDLSTGEEIAGRYWSFGDGTLSTETDPVHTYLKNGTYDVSLTVVNAAGPSVATKSQYIVVSVSSAPPTANFTANVTSGTIPFTVQFTDTSTGDPIFRLWSFGDGNTSTNQHPVHTYILPGTYTVNLTVSNDNGSDMLSRPDYITVTRVKGDFNGNGVIDIGDVALVAYMVVGKTPADPAADFNENGAVDIGDAAKIAYYFVEKIPAL